MQTRAEKKKKRKDKSILFEERLSFQCYKIESLAHDNHPRSLMVATVLRRIKGDWQQHERHDPEPPNCSVFLQIRNPGLANRKSRVLCTNVKFRGQHMAPLGSDGKSDS